MTSRARIPYTRSQLAADINALGVIPGDVVMLHASYKAIGPVMGGPNEVVHALLDALTPAGTLMMYVGWNDIPDFLRDLPEAVQGAYRENHPPFDPLTARAVRDHGILAECVRTWPGSRRSMNPEASVCAVGARATWITGEHPLNYGYGAGSPFAKLVEARGRVLTLGAPLDTITLLHHAENRARIRHKRIVRYAVPLLRDGRTVWVDVEDFDTGDPLDDYTFDQIARAYLRAGGGQQGRIGDAESYLFNAADLVAFAVDWLELHFGG